MVLRCPSCDALVVDTMTKCPVCQGSLGASAPQPSETSPPLSDPGPPPTRPQHGVGTRAPTASSGPPGVSRVPVVSSKRSSAASADATVARVPPAARSTVPPEPIVGSMPAATRGGLPGATPTVPGRGRARFLILGSIFAAVCLLALAAALVVGGSSTGKVHTVTLESVDHDAPHPFTASVASVKASTMARFHTTIEGVGTGGSGDSSTRSELALKSVQGSHGSLYGVDSAKAVCDVSRFAKLIVGNRPLQRAWAASMGIEVAKVDDAIAVLTPVLLGQDTAVTDHAYADDEVSAFQAILQAGTAVLIDDHGAPRVRCASGSPLDRSDTGGTKVRLSGTPWHGFATGSVVAVTPTAEPITMLRAVDIGTGDPVTVSVGGGGGLSGTLVMDDADVRVIGADGTSTVVIDHPVARAFDDGMGGLIYQEVRPAPQYGSPFDVELTPPADADQASIWRLAAGSKTPSRLIESVDYTKDWFAAMTVGSIGGRQVLVYARVPAGVSDSPASSLHGSLHVLDLTTGNDRRIADDVIGYEHVLGPVTIAHDTLAYAVLAEGEPSWVFLDVDLDPISNACTRSTSKDNPCAGGRVLDDDGNLVGFRVSGSFESIASVTVVDPKTGALLRSTPTQYSENIGEGGYDVGLDVSGSVALMWFRADSPARSTSVVRYDLAKGVEAKTDLQGRVWLLRAPLRPS